MLDFINNDWQQLLERERKKEYFARLEDFLLEEYSQHTIYPAQEDIYNSLKYTPYNEVKVVFLGQDPYHGPHQAHGLSFSVKPGVKKPPSLVNIFKELQADIGCPIPETGYLKEWATQGVLMLNTVLTVRDGLANSHRGKGWEVFTNEIIKELNKRQEPVVFVLWGKPAQEKMKLIDTNRHRIITSSHPSPLSAYRGFFGSKPFSQINAILEELGTKPINWCADDCFDKE
ncbi:uracil-DNA glycosylase [Niallia circulans]|uniref:Uracil-DNA glycosylase n=1 Tax=Niallia circulans TaxID=1397 RepID=A0A553SI30_NIACI|nr:uracil-DNA glycosylase [Niallia circulans]TRZ36647.1 uracil-DNA glycosylase [Niallia circulans]